MRCPVCADEKLVITERQGVEIDYCPSCRGVWLDRGELDKILERSAPPRANQSARGGSDSRSDHRHQPNQPHQQKRKKSFLEELFD